MSRQTVPAWIKPELAALVKAAPDGDGWLHEIKLDGYRMHARIEEGSVKIITRRGNDWTDKYPSIARALLEPSLPQARLRARPGGDRLEARRRSIRIRPALLAQDQMPEPRGIRGRGLVGPGALLLGYYTEDGKLIYAGRVGTGMPVAELERLYGRLQPLTVAKMALSERPPRGGRFGSPLVLSRVHWVRPEMVVEVSYVDERRMVCSGMSSI